MNEAISCPGCEVQLLLPALPAGQTVACPRCQRVFEPAAQQKRPAPAPVQRPRTPMLVEKLADDAPALPLAHSVSPRGVRRGYLAILLLAVSSLTFAVQAYCEFELILLIHAQEGRGAPRHVFGEFIGGERPGPLFRIAAAAPNPQQEVLDDRWERWEEFAPTSNFLVRLAYGPAMLALFIWLYRAHKNLPGLKAQGLSYTPAWALIAFFVPVFNFFVPFAFIQEIWRASHPHAIETGQTWRKSPFARSVRIWWLFYAAGIVLWGLAFFTKPNFPQTYDELLTSAWFALAASICSSGAGVTLIYIIRKITQRQQQRQGNF